LDRDPFRIEPPFAVSFSGGRTSGYMLLRILQAYGGKLPADSIVLFANTGLEEEATLRFVQTCSERWMVPIIWVEYRPKVNGKKQYAVVNFESASRNGEPFEAVIRDRNYLPNPVTRFCTAEMKIRSMHKHLRSLGWEEWSTCIGIRADEERRLAKMRARGRSTETPDETPIAPLADAGVTVEEVGQFWRENDFDLELPNMNGRTMHGNCSLCFLKGAGQILSLIRERPERAHWWMKMESLGLSSKPSGTMFRSDRPSYEQMYRMATDHGELFPFSDESIEDCACTD